MTTSASDRLAKLLDTSKRPVPPSSQQPTFAQQELAALAERKAKWKIPDVAQYPRKIPGPQPKPAAGGGDIYTSSDDEDDYAAAFSKKPRMSAASAKKNKSRLQLPRKMPEPTAFGYDSAQVPEKGVIAYVGYGGATGDAPMLRSHAMVTQKLPKEDDQGNPVTGHFCLFNLVAKFPYKYMVDENDRVSRHFFANQKFFERTWDLYYLHQPESFLTIKPILLLPYHQVKTLIDEISTVFKVNARVPPDPFTMSFFVDGTPQPIFLGTTMSRADINDLQDSIPLPPKGFGEPPLGCSEKVESSFAAFKAKHERIQAEEKRKKAAIKKKKAEARSSMIKDWCKSVRRTQCYLGLRPVSPQIRAAPADLPWDEQVAFNEQQEIDSVVTLDRLDINLPAPYECHSWPVIVTADIESWEEDHNMITEVGLGVVDTLDIKNIAPGEGGAEWMKQIRSRHFRIKGREHLINKKYVHGDGNAFQFGKSEWVSLEDIGDIIDSCLEWPFCIQFKHDGRLKSYSEAELDAKPECLNNDHADVCNTDNSPDPTKFQKGPKERKILLVGHDLAGDLAYLAKLNSAVFSQPRDGTTMYPPAAPDSAVSPDARAARGAHILSNIVEALDTATLYKVLHKEQNNRSLTFIMADIGRSAFYAHNGGNDARYTMEALIGLTIKSRLMDDEAETLRKTENDVTHGNAWEAEKERRISEKVAGAKAEVEEEMKAWEEAGATGTSASGSSRSSPKCQQKEFDENATVQNDGGDSGNNDTWNFQPFSKTLETTHAAQNKKKKSAEEKRREWEMKVREEDGIEGPCDWAVGGKDGVGK